MHNFSMLLTQKCLSMGLIDKSYSEWLSYSIEKRATTLLTWFVLCLVGFFGFGWKLTLSFSIFFLLIRKYTNGYHAATYSHCLFLSILMEIIIFTFVSSIFYFKWALPLILTVSSILIWCIAPVNTASIHWSECELKIVKTAVRWLLFILNALAILLIKLQIAPSILQGLSAALAADAITLFISSCQKLKGGRTNENSSQGIRQKENCSSGKEGYTRVATSLYRMVVPTATSPCI